MKKSSGKFALKIAGIGGGLIFLGLCVASMLVVPSPDNVAKVANEAITKRDFKVNKDINTETLIGNHFKNVNGFHIYEDKMVKFYVDNPVLRGEDSDTFFVNFEAKNEEVCTSTARTFNDSIFYPERHLLIKDVTLDGKSIKKALEENKKASFRNAAAYFDCKEKAANETYKLKYEFYFQ